MPQTANEARVARVVVRNATGDTRTLVATAAAEYTPEGLSVVVTVTNSASGIAPPPIGTINLYFVIDDDADSPGTTRIRGVALDSSLASQQFTFFFTSNGQSGGALRHGTIRIKIEGGGGSTPNNWFQNSDNTSTALPVGWSADWNKGWIIGETEIAVDVSNEGVGVAPIEPAEPLQSLHHRTVFGSASYKNRAVTHNIGPSGNLTQLSAVSTADTGATRSHTFVSVVDDRFPPGVTQLIAGLSLPNSVLAGKAYTRPLAGAALPTDTIDVDPRLYIPTTPGEGHLMQVNVPAYGTPPSINQDADEVMDLQTDQGYFGVRFVGARGTPINGVLGRQTLDPDLPGNNIVHNFMTANRGGQDGWSDTLMEFVLSKPAGLYTKTVTATDTRFDAPGSYVVNPIRTYQFLGARSTAVEMIRGGGAAGDVDAHLSAGMTAIFGAALKNVLNGKILTPDATPTPKWDAQRLNIATGRAEYLLIPGYTWPTIPTDAENPTFVLPSYAAGSSPSDPRIKLVQIVGTDSALWGGSDFFVTMRLYYEGIQYVETFQVQVLGTANSHSDDHVPVTGWTQLTRR